MQKIAKDASILIWSIFLSLIMSVSFISVSTTITKNLKENEQIKKNVKISTQKENILNTAINTKIFENKELSSTQSLIFEENNNVEVWLKQWEEYLIETNKNQNFTIQILDWSSIEYENLSNNSIKWLINNVATFDSWIGKIKLKNLWWYARIKISSEWKFLTEYKNYKIIELIWNRKIVKEIWRLKIF